MKDWRELKPHKLNVFPPMQDWEFDELKMSILKNGYDSRQPIKVYVKDEVPLGIIDGANRHRACLELNIIPYISHFYGSESEAMEYILKTNVRRNLNAGQKAAVVLDMKDVVKKIRKEASESRASNLPNSKNKKKVPRVRTAESISKIANVSERTVAQAIKIKKVDPELYEAVKDGKISAKSAYNQIQDKIRKSDVWDFKQDRAKNWIKWATQDALDAKKNEFYDIWFERYEKVQSGEVKLFPFEFELTIKDWDGKCIYDQKMREQNSKYEASNPKSAASFIDYHKATKESPAIKKD